MHRINDRFHQTETLRADKALETGEQAAGDAPKLAPITNAHNLMLRVLMPIAAAATSSSRIAIHARPMREYCRLTIQKSQQGEGEEQVVMLVHE